MTIERDAAKWKLLWSVVAAAIGERFALRTNAHISKSRYGHPGLKISRDMGHPGLQLCELTGVGGTGVYGFAYRP